MARAPFARVLRGLAAAVDLCRRQETAERLMRAGFTEIETWLEDRPHADGGRPPFHGDGCLVRHLDPLPAQLRGAFVDEVIGQLAEPLVLDYVRLNMRARRA